MSVKRVVPVGMGKRPTVRGSVMNPADHPHGGGEGRAPIGREIPGYPLGQTDDWVTKPGRKTSRLTSILFVTVKSNAHAQNRNRKGRLNLWVAA